ncbi:MAG: hypothetical protein AMXMBFR23_02220 [Chloroflexota bacterium]
MSIVTWERERPLVNPMANARPVLASIATVVIASVFISLTAQPEVRVGPVPFSLQTLSVLLVGAALGSRLGFAAVSLYVMQGLAGLPVFSGGNGGWTYFAAAPSAGYIVGFAFAAFAVGWLAEHGWSRHVLTVAAAMVIGNIVIYVFGVVRLSDFVGWDGVWEFGVRPFLAGDAIKIAIAAGLLPAAWKLRGVLFGVGGKPGV